MLASVEHVYESLSCSCSVGDTLEHDSCNTAHRSALSVLVDARFDDDGKETDGQFDEFFWSVRSVRIEEQRITRFHSVDVVTVPVGNPALGHIDELHPRVLEQGKDIRLLGQRDRSR